MYVVNIFIYKLADFSRAFVQLVNVTSAGVAFAFCREQGRSWTSLETKLLYQYYCNTKAQTQLTACTYRTTLLSCPHSKHCHGRQAPSDILPKIGTELKLSHQLKTTRGGIGLGRRRPTFPGPILGTGVYPITTVTCLLTYVYANWAASVCAPRHTNNHNSTETSHINWQEAAEDRKAVNRCEGSRRFRCWKLFSFSLLRMF